MLLQRLVSRVAHQRCSVQLFLLAHLLQRLGAPTVLCGWVFPGQHQSVASVAPKQLAVIIGHLAIHGVKLAIGLLNVLLLAQENLSLEEPFPSGQKDGSAAQKDI
jgi:hypothetical protein